MPRVGYCWCVPSRGRGGPACRASKREALKVAVMAPPQDGRANQALTETLRDVLGLKRSQVELIAGQTSRDKRFLIRGLTRAELESRLTELSRA